MQYSGSGSRMPAVVEVDERAEVLERARVGGARRRRRAARSARPSRSPRAAPRPTVTAANGALRVRGGEREQPHPGGEPVLRPTRASSVTVAAARRRDAGDGAAEQAAVGQRDAHVDRAPAPRRRASAARRGHDRVDDRRRPRRSPARPSDAGRQRPARDLGQRSRVRPSTPASRASSSRWPTPQRSQAVELDRQRVLDLVGVVGRG